MKNDELRPHAEAFCKTRTGAWKLIGRVGSGNSASVYQLEAGDRTAALKIYHPRFFEGSNAGVEKRRVLNQMSLQGHGNPNLIDFFDAGEINDTHFLLMEFFPWRSLDQQLGTIDRSKIGEIISKISDAAEYLEGRNFVHRDIKPANVLVSDNCEEVKLLDLGVMRPISTDDNTGGTDQGYSLPFVATAQYSSPAYLFREGPPTADMWKALTFYQIGAVLHDLLMRRPLFQSEVRTGNRYRVAAAVLLTTPEVHAPEAAPWLVALARNCLVKEDGFRLNRVSWNSFHADRRLNLDELRNQLGLRRFESADRTDSMEQLKLRLNRGRETLIDICRHILRKENFPNAGMRKDLRSTPHSRSVMFSFIPRASQDPNTKLHFILRISMQNNYQDQVDIFLSSFMTKQDGKIPCKYNEYLLWTTKLDDLEIEHEQLTSLLTEQFIGRYAEGDSHLHMFQSSHESTLEVDVGWV